MIGPMLLLTAANLFTAGQGVGALEGPTLSWGSTADLGSEELGEPRDPRFRLLPLADGWLGLIAVDGKAQLRSPTGKWSDVIDLPIERVVAAASDGSALLVAGERPRPDKSWQVVVLSLGIDGHFHARWEMPGFLLQSLAAGQNARWATGYTGFRGHDGPKVLWALLSDGKIEPRDELPTIIEDGHGVLPWRVFLYLGPSQERVFCVPQTCQHDLPCHYARCYRRDKVVWRAYGKWVARPVLCGSYLLEQELPITFVRFLPHSHSRTVIRRISDGATVASVGTSPNEILSCARPGSFVAADTSVRAMSLSNGRRQWSVPIRAGHAVAVAQAGECTIALTDQNEMMSICLVNPLQAG